MRNVKLHKLISLATMNSHTVMDPEPYRKLRESIENDLNAWDIVRKKEVNVAWLSYVSSAEEYNKGGFIGEYLTDEEFNFIKENKKNV